MPKFPSEGWYETWLPRAQLQVDELEKRIHRLDGKFYTGCGFHYDMHDSLEHCRRLLGKDTSDDDMLNIATRIIARVSVSHLTKRVIDAEKSYKILNKVE